MPTLLRAAGWVACVIYSTIPAFWLLIHPRAKFWRSHRFPYRMLLSMWVGIWLVTAAITAPWRSTAIYENALAWIPAAVLFVAGLTLYKLSGKRFSLAQLAGLPEVFQSHRQQTLVTTGIRSRIRHPVYLGHLCEMLAWSVGTGLAMCWALTAWAIASGAVMINLEDRELEERFGDVHRQYRSAVPAVLPRISRS
jgi:methanethiol S-methyltransferase